MKKFRQRNWESSGQSCWNYIFKHPRWRAFKRRTACLIPGKKSCSSHLFGGGPKPGCSDRLRVGIIKSHNFFVLGPIMVKFHVRTRLIESFPATFLFWCCPEKSCTAHHFTLYANWSVTKRCFHHLEGRRVSSKVPADTCTPVLGVGKIWRPCDLRSMGYKGL